MSVPIGVLDAAWVERNATAVITVEGSRRSLVGWAPTAVTVSGARGRWAVTYPGGDVQNCGTGAAVVALLTEHFGQIDFIARGDGRRPEASRAELLAGIAMGQAAPRGPASAPG